MTRPLIRTSLLLFIVVGLAASTLSAQRHVAQSALAESRAVESTAHAPFTGFEAGAVQPMLVTKDGKQLLVLNASDGRLEIFDIREDGPALDARTAPGHSQATERNGNIDKAPAGIAVPGGFVPGGVLGGTGTPATDFRLIPAGSIFTGLEPVAIAAHETKDEIVFVSNAVSDTVVVVNLDERRVVATVPVGDEPSGLVALNGSLFVTAARSPEQPPAPGQADLGKFRENTLVVMRANPPYTVLKSSRLPSVKPRDIIEVDGTLFVISQNSGNRTTLLPFQQALATNLKQDEIDAFNPVIDLNPNLNNSNILFPAFAPGWAIPVVSRIVFDTEVIGPFLPDADVMGISPGSLQFQSVTRGVGTTLFDIEHNPVDDSLWVAASDANNRIRFEPVLRGVAVDNRVSIVDPVNETVEVLSLEPPFLPQREGQPVALEIASGAFGDYAYVASLGTARITVIDATTRTYVQSIETGMLPIGLEVDQERGLLFVLSRGDMAVHVYDIANGHARVGVPVSLGYDPEPPLYAAGRVHLYDAREEHGNGTMSCSACHIFGHHDSSAWDLGDPGGSLAYFYPDVLGHVAGQDDPKPMVDPTQVVNHPLKGPMTTQSLRGLIPSDGAQNLPLHWRGDRRFFQMFRNAFVGLQDGSGITNAEMQEFAAFARDLAFPPNPYQPKDRQYTGIAATGRDIFGLNPNVPGKFMQSHAEAICLTCHFADFENGTDYTGGLPGINSGVSLMLNMPTLRGVYEKEYKALTGFGVLHDGEMNGVRGFFEASQDGVMLAPNFTPEDRDAVSEFVRQWDTGLSPMIGSQVFASPGTSGQTQAFLNLAEAEAQLGNADLMLKGTLLATTPPMQFGGYYHEVDDVWGYELGSGAFVSRAGLLQFLGMGSGTALFTSVPPGTGERYGIDRDEDGLSDSAEVEAGTRLTHPDSDGDGYTDGYEVRVGGNPRGFNQMLPDIGDPIVESSGVFEIFADTATLTLITDEPVELSADIRLADGGIVATTVSGDGLRQRHDVVLDELPAGTDLEAVVTATDRNGNTTVSTIPFTTAPPLLHVDVMTLDATGTGPHEITATVRIVDHRNMPVEGVPVRGFWEGDLGGANWQQEAITDAAGVATFLRASVTQVVVTPVTFSVAYVGSVEITSPYFVGLGVTDWVPTFFYEQSMNAANFRTIDLP